MHKESIDAEDEKILRSYVKKLPIIMEQSKEIHIMTGAEILETGAHEIDGEPINLEKKYEYPMPVQIQVNHYRRIKSAWLKDGQPGVQKYLNEVAAAIKAKEN